MNYNGIEEEREMFFQSALNCNCENKPVIRDDVVEAGKDYYVHTKLLVRLLAAGLTCQTPLSAFHKSLKLELAILGETKDIVDIKRLTVSLSS